MGAQQAQDGPERSARTSLGRGHGAGHSRFVMRDHGIAAGAVDLLERCVTIGAVRDPDMGFVEQAEMGGDIAHGGAIVWRGQGGPSAAGPPRLHRFDHIFPVSQARRGRKGGLIEPHPQRTGIGERGVRAHQAHRSSWPRPPTRKASSKLAGGLTNWSKPTTTTIFDGLRPPSSNCNRLCKTIDRKVRPLRTGL